MKKYIDFNPQQGCPVGRGLFYECGRCGDVVVSNPEDSLSCSCRNIFIDVDAGRVSVADESKISIFLREE